MRTISVFKIFQKDTGSIVMLKKASKYKNWTLDRISFESGWLSLHVARYSLLPAEAADLDSQHVQAQLMFPNVTRIKFSRISSGLHINDICQKRDSGKIICTIEFSGNAVIEVCASDVVDLLI
jgi:hypothetical protein